jgi:hypothetical protein
MRDLLSRLQSLIERTYALDPAPDASLYVIGDAGLSRLYAAHDAGRPMLLVRHVDGAHRLRVYYPDRLVENLELHDPARGLSAHNIRDFSAFVEELDHFLQVVTCARRQREVSPVELELHANVTKVLVAWLFAARTLGVERLGRQERDEVRHELLERGDFGTESPELRERYRDARRHAVRFLSRLERCDRAERPRLLSRFSRAPLQEKIRLAA